MTITLPALAALLFAAPAMAHEVAKGPHGGRVAEAGPYHVELVAGDGTVSVWVTDGDDRPISAAGFRGTATLLVNGKVQHIVLQPAEGRLAGPSPAPLAGAVKGVVQLTAPNGATAQGRFE